MQLVCHTTTHGLFDNKRARRSSATRFNRIIMMMMPEFLRERRPHHQPPPLQPFDLAGHAWRGGRKCDALTTEEGRTVPTITSIEQWIDRSIDQLLLIRLRVVKLLVGSDRPSNHHPRVATHYYRWDPSEDN
jgi:hypothetical protein